MRHHALADGRERHEPRGALDQRHAEIFLKLPQLAAESWLGDATALRRTAEVSQVRDRDQVAQLGKSRGSSFTLSIDEIASLDWTNEPIPARLPKDWLRVGTADRRRATIPTRADRPLGQGTSWRRDAAAHTLRGEIGGRMIGPDTETGCGRWLTPARRGLAQF